ncbi:uncharacterized protein A1O5_05706 [Cladophialophora psammophila CBS 110553]|uniref:Major facilitator superfamily (MFS) profile domain-containing protein n=1 Tax=Cladophialophora psammophila CBS 110553 TaxID=1182543 RepID=W9X1A7_9EURO|nr:uncharacterized protein A1O5_05706 [Cladophialophora psammophila CBS 110553]EXJ70716.1 hypothetical protein A1O5_05706 [Cladophialophora psammophila CBS 110553]
MSAKPRPKVEEEVSSPQRDHQLDDENLTPDEEYPHGKDFVAIVTALLLAFIIIGLDYTVLATAVPTMTKHFGTIEDIGWYTSVYRLAASSFQFLFGRLYSLFPVKRILLITLVLFAGGVLACALAPTSPFFIMGRGVTGFAAAGVIAGAFSMIIRSFPLSKRSIYAGIGGAAEATACLTAPLLGGFLTDRLSWRWCFYVELPLIGAAFIIVAFFFNPKKDPSSPSKFGEKLAQLDLLGMTFFVPSITFLMLGLQWGGTKYGWQDWRIIAIFCVFAVLLLLFGWLQYRKQDRATLPPRIVSQRNIIFGFIFSCCNNAALSVIEYYMPIYFQAVRGLSASMSGVMVLPVVAGLVLSVFSSGVLTSRLGFYTPFMLSTSVITPPAVGLMTTLGVDATLASLIGYQALLGFGVGIGFQGPQVAVQTILPEKDAPVGIAVIQFAQGIGPAVFVAAAQTLFTQRLAHNIKHFVPEVDYTSLSRDGLVNLSSYVKAPYLAGAIRSVSTAVMQTFYLPVALSCMTLVGALGMEWRSVKKKHA